jgi:F-type H+-transporting ATPase subunit b
MEFSAWTIVYQAILFVALYLILKQLVFDPFLANLDARHRRTRGALEEAAKLREEVAELQADYERQMNAIRREAAAAAEEIRRQAEKEEQQIVEAARHEAARSMAQAREAIAAQTQATRAALAADVTRLTEEILANLLGRRT